MLSETARARCRRFREVPPTRGHVASIGGIQNFASNLAGIVITTFTGFMVAMTKGSFTIPLIVAGGFCFLGAFSYLFIVGKIEPLSGADDDAAAISDDRAPSTV